MLHEDLSKLERYGGVPEYDIVAFLVLNTSIPTVAPTKPKISKVIRNPLCFLHGDVDTSLTQTAFNI
jgi:hypothetical protein